jgi:hypothetical protein
VAPVGLKPGLCSGAGRLASLEADEDEGKGVMGGGFAALCFMNLSIAGETVDSGREGDEGWPAGGVTGVTDEGPDGAVEGVDWAEQKPGSTQQRTQAISKIHGQLD